MELIRMGLLLYYAVIRAIPFAVTVYFVIGTKKTENNREYPFFVMHKAFLTIMGLGINAIVFIGTHYCHYNDLEIIAYIKNVWGLNFYHHDVEYFIMSASLAIILSMPIGIFLRVFLNRKQMWHLTKEQQFVAVSAGFLAFGLIILGFEIRDYYHSHIQINEICSNNKSFILDENGLIEDYVEIYNSGILPCQISELYLSDDRYDLQKLSLEGKVVVAGDMLVVPCIEGVDSFSISNKGEVIYLSDAEGNILEQVEIGEVENDKSYVRVDDTKWEIENCSPGTANETAVTYQVEKPILSHESGFYDDEFDLKITCAEDVTVYYTLDGSIPDEGSLLYENSIQVYDKSAEPNVWRSIQNVVLDWKNYTPNEESVDKAFLVRAVAVDDKGNKSDEAIATYFINKEQYKGKKVISLIADPKDLFSDETGIYVTGKAYDEWYLNGQEGEEPNPHFKSGSQEREAVIELFETSESVFQQDVGIRIQGASARERKDKRFSVYAREEYDGSELFDVNLFNRETAAHSILIKEGLGDVICQELMENRGIPIQRGEEVYLFLNGEYWYDNRYLREKYSTQYFEDNYGIAKDNLVLYKGGRLNKGVETDQIFYDSLYAYAQEKDFSNETVYEKFCETVDVANYIDYLAVNIYCANMDMDNNKNVVMWRAREASDSAYSDGKWRWALYDMDAIEWNNINYYEVEEAAAIDSFSQEPKYAKCAFNQGILYSALRKNEEFCKQFVLTFMDLLNTNFTVNAVNDTLKEYGQDTTWLNSFFEKRPDYMKAYLAKEFELSGTVETVRICNEEEEKGTVSINSITPKMENGRWTGEYYTDYPISVTAEPMTGYKFVGWSGSVNSEKATIEVPVEEGGIVLEATFQKIE